MEPPSARDILVLAQGRPACKTGTPVTVNGHFDGATKRIDAIVVDCR